MSRKLRNHPIRSARRVPRESPISHFGIDRVAEMYLAALSDAERMKKVLLSACRHYGFTPKDAPKTKMLAGELYEVLASRATRTDVDREKGFGASDFSLELWATLKRNPAWPCDVAYGEEHAQQLFARWLVSGSFDAPSQRPIARSAATPACPEPAERGCADEQVPQTGMPALQDPPTGKEEA